MLPPSLFAERQFAATNAVTFVVYAALTGATFLLPLVLQIVSGYSPLASGLALLPLTAIMLALSARSRAARGQDRAAPAVERWSDGGRRGGRSHAHAGHVRVQPAAGLLALFTITNPAHVRHTAGAPATSF